MQLIYNDSIVTPDVGSLCEPRLFCSFPRCECHEVFNVGKKKKQEKQKKNVKFFIKN